MKMDRPTWLLSSDIWDKLVRWPKDRSDVINIHREDLLTETAISTWGVRNEIQQRVIKDAIDGLSNEAD